MTCFFAILFFVLLKNTFDSLLKKNNFKNADVLRQYRSAVIVTLIAYAIVCIVYLTYDFQGFLQSIELKWLLVLKEYVKCRLYQNVWDVVKLLGLILCSRAWKILYNPNRIK